MGVTRATGLGQVYNLKKLADFDGNYVAGGAEVTVAGGAGVTGMKKSERGGHRAKSTTQGPASSWRPRIKLSVVK